MTVYSNNVSQILRQLFRYLLLLLFSILVSLHDLIQPCGHSVTGLGDLLLDGRGCLFKILASQFLTDDGVGTLRQNCRSVLEICEI